MQALKAYCLNFTYNRYRTYPAKALSSGIHLNNLLERYDTDIPSNRFLQNTPNWCTAPFSSVSSNLTMSTTDVKTEDSGRGSSNTPIQALTSQGPPSWRDFTETSVIGFFAVLLTEHVKAFFLFENLFLWCGINLLCTVLLKFLYRKFQSLSSSW